MAQVMIQIVPQTRGKQDRRYSEPKARNGLKDHSAKNSQKIPHYQSNVLNLPMRKITTILYNTNLGS